MSAESATPRLVGRRVALRPLFQSDYDFLYRIAGDPTNEFRWRYRGITPSPEEFARGLWAHVHTQFIIVRRADSERVGLATAYEENLRDGWTNLAVLTSPRFIGTGAAIEGCMLFIDYLFFHFPLRKIYMDVPEFNLESISSGLGKFLTVEGRRAAHIFHAETYWDLLTLTVTRESWGETRTAIGTSLDASSPVDRPVVDRADPEGPSRLSLDGFCVLVAEMFGLSPQGVRPDSRLGEDLGIDSLGLVELNSHIDDLVGEVEDDPFLDVLTVRDAYLYLSRVSQRPRLS